MMTRLNRGELLEHHLKERFFDERPELKEDDWKVCWGELNLIYSSYAFRSAATYYYSFRTGKPITSEWAKKGRESYEKFLHAMQRFDIARRKIDGA